MRHENRIHFYVCPTGEQVAEIGALYGQGFTLADIGQRFGVGQDAARRAVLDAGGTIRRPGRRAAVG